MITKLKKEDLLFRNNTGNKSQEALVEGFVIRIKEFEEIYRSIKKLGNSEKLQPNLIIGQRGAGKTTLLYRLKYEIESDQHLRKWLFPIMFTEEQYNLSELVNLWETVASTLEDNYGWAGFSKEVEKVLLHEKNYEPLVYELLDRRLKEEGKTVILFIENISVFLRKLSAEARERFRDVFTSNMNFNLVASSTSYFDGYINYEKAPFHYFNITRLGGLSREECEVMLVRIGKQFGAEEDIRYIIDNHPGRVEALRRLTGGVPRTISYLFQIFLDNENGKAISDLYVLIDTLTFLYKSELDQLSSQQQKVIDVIARKWDAISVKEITRLTRFESKNVSSILAALEKNQIIETIHTKTKNHLYRIRERFMNIWYLMRFGRKHDKDSIIWLVRFFDAWCDETELAKRVTAHIDNLKGGEFDLDAAIDMGNTFLSCENLTQELKMLLYKETKSILPEKLAKSLNAPGDFLYRRIQALAEEKEFTQAVELLEQIETKDIEYYRVATWLFLVIGNYSKSAEAAEYVLNLEKSDANAALILGIIYEDHLHDIEKAESYLKLSLEQNPMHPYAASRMGEIAYKYKNDLIEAEKYHRLAIKKNFKPSLLWLGDIFFREKQFDKAKELYLDAISAKVDGANSKLGILYATMDDARNARKYFSIAIKENEKDAVVDMGIWYRVRKRPDFSKAEHYFRKAIDEGIVRAYSLLGDLYNEELKDTKRAIEIYRLGVEHGDPESAHQLAHIYSDAKNFTASDEMFEKALELGDGDGVICFISSIYSSGRTAKKAYALELFKKYLPSFDELDVSVKILYARILLWNDRDQESLNAFQSTYAQLSEIIDDVDDRNDEAFISSTLSQVSRYMLLLIAQEKYTQCLSLFEESGVDFKTMLRPIYFLLMEYLKKDFPLEYLKAGNEFEDTIKELRFAVNVLRKKV